MTPAALALVVVAALCHTTWNLLLKAERNRLEFVLWALVVGVVLFAPAPLFYPMSALTPAAWLLVLISGFFEAAYVFALTAAYGAGDFSVVYPIARGTPPALVAPLAVVLLGEQLSLQGIIGIVLVVIGIYASYLGSFRAWAVLRSPQNRRASGLALLTGGLTTAYSLANKAGVQVVPIALYIFLVYAVQSVLVAIALGVSGHLTSPPWRDWKRGVTMLTVGALMLAAYFAVILAMSMAPASYVVATREVSVVVAALLGAVVLKERHTVARVTAAVVIFAGLVVIALAR